MLVLEVVPIPDQTQDSEKQVRDESDRPILRAALAADADIILTGDLDLLQAELTSPLVLTPSQFLEK